MTRSRSYGGGSKIEIVIGWKKKVKIYWKTNHDIFIN